jgi:TonB family protein
MYTEMERFNSYVDAFKRWFPQKVHSKETVAKLTLVKDKKLSGHAGREYRVNIGDLSGVADVFVTRRRFYAVVFLNTKKDDEQNEERFLSSFTLPERILEAPATVAAQQSENQTGAATPPETKPPKKQSADDDALPKQENASDTGNTDVTAANPTSEAQKRKAPISGGVLNGKALSLPKPDYPAEARAAGATGTVVVQVTVDEQGSVIAAKAVSGPQLLHQASVNAALQARFQPTFLMGEAVKVTGMITYNFVRQ